MPSCTALAQVTWPGCNQLSIFPACAGGDTRAKTDRFRKGPETSISVNQAVTTPSAGKPFGIRAVKSIADKRKLAAGLLIRQLVLQLFYPFETS